MCVCLHHHKQYGSFRSAAVLLAAGGDPRIPNCWGKSAVTIAIDKLDTQYSPAREGLMHLLKRRADEMDAEDTHRQENDDGDVAAQEN